MGDSWHHGRTHGPTFQSTQTPIYLPSMDGFWSSLTYPLVPKNGTRIIPRIPAQCPKWIKATRSGVTTGGISRTFPSLGQGDLGEKARSKLSKRRLWATPQMEPEQGHSRLRPLAPYLRDAAGPTLLENGYPALHEEQRGGDQTESLFLGYSSSMEGQLLPMRCGQIAFTILGTTG